MRIPGSYARHQQTILRQSLRALDLPQQWDQPIAQALHHIPLPHPTLPLSNSEPDSSFLSQAPNFQPYPVPISFELDPEEEDVLYPSARKHRRFSSTRLPPGGFPSDGTFEDEADHQPSEEDQLERERPQWKGKRAVLVVSLWYDEKDGEQRVEGGVEGRKVCWVPDRWALPPAQDSLSEASPGELGLKGRSKGRVILGSVDENMNSQDWYLVGGTLVVSTLDHLTDETFASLEKVFRMAIYMHLSHALEIPLVQSHSYTLDPPLPPSPIHQHSDNLPGRKSSEHTPPSGGEEGEGRGSLFKRRKKGPKKTLFGGFWDTLTGQSAKSSPNRDRAALARVESEPVMPRGRQNSLGPPLKDEKEEKAVKSQGKYSRIVEIFEKTMFSTTPAVGAFPVPPLFLHLQETESPPKRPIEVPQPHSPDELGNTTARSCEEPKGGSKNRWGEKAPEGLRLTVEARSGLGVFGSMADCGSGHGNGMIFGLESFWKQQSITLLYQVSPISPASIDPTLPPVSPYCKPPHFLILPYVHMSLATSTPTPVSLGGFVRTLSERAKKGVRCDKAGCEKNEMEHTRVWVHGGINVNARCSIEIEEDLKNGVDCWVECQICQKKSPVHQLSSAAEQVPFGKYLEMLIYSNHVLQPTTPLCGHTTAISLSSAPSTPNPNLARVFRCHGVKVMLITTVLDVYDLKLSKLVPKLRAAKPNGESTIGGFDDSQRVSAHEMRKRTVGREVEGFYEVLEERVDALKEQLAAQGVPLKQTLVSNLHALLLDICSEKEDILSSIDQSDKASGRLNDVRRTFMQKSREAEQKLKVWEENEGSVLGVEGLPLLDLHNRSPKYFTDKDVHALPGSSILFQEDQPASLIAHTLSSTDYLKELFKSKPTAPTTAFNSETSSICSDDLVFSPFSPPAYSTTLTRAEHSKDFSTALFSLRKKPSDAFLGVPSLMSILPNSGKLNYVFGNQKSGNEPTVSMGIAEGSMSGSPADKPSKGTEKSVGEEALDIQKLHHLLSGSTRTTPMPPSTSPSPLVSGHMTPVSSAFPFPTAPMTRLEHTDVCIPVQTPILSRQPSTQSMRLSTSFGSSKEETWTSSLTSALSSSVTNILQYGPNTLRGKPPASVQRLSASRTPSTQNLQPSSLHIDPKPHFHLTTTSNKKREITCVVYYAAAFQALRCRLGVESSLINSLEKTIVWNAQGGKSKAAFFKTADDRYIVKELVSKWNISDVQALLDIAPAYFDYIMGGGSTKPTVMAKILGFYTIKVHDFETNQTHKRDLLVMENLFYHETISKTFDLKGIDGRRFKSVVDDDALPLLLGHDLDWVENIRDNPILIHPYAQKILHDAISNDAKFLSSNFIMDYSLLVGIDRTHHALSIGIVDAIGAFTLLKALESKGKQMTKKDGSTITVLPPDQYRVRFESAMESYFLVCPDRFSHLPPHWPSTSAIF